MVKETDYDEDKSESFEINYTNNKGFFIYLTKNLELIGEFRLTDNYAMWFKTLDALYLATFPFWKNPKEKEEYEELYNEALKMLSNKSNNNNNVTRAFNNKTLRILRAINSLVSENTSHLMIRLSGADSEDSAAWEAIMNETSEL